MKSCLIVVDAQYDFFPGGALAVPEGDKIIPVVNKLLPEFDLVIFTKDWHPADHKCFASQHDGKKVLDVIDLNGVEQILWPDHCVENTTGADFHKDIDFSKIKKDFYIFKKGMDSEVDSYSGFFDNDKKNSTGLKEFLKERNIKEVFMVGLATDYCVAATAIDARMNGFVTTVIWDGCRGIEEDLTHIYEAFIDAEVLLTDSEEYLERNN